MQRRRLERWRNHLVRAARQDRRRPQLASWWLSGFLTHLTASIIQAFAFSLKWADICFWSDAIKAEPALLKRLPRLRLADQFPDSLPSMIVFDVGSISWSLGGFRSAGSWRWHLRALVGSSRWIHSLWAWLPLRSHPSGNLRFEYSLILMFPCFLTAITMTQVLSEVRFHTGCRLLVLWRL